MSTHNINSMNFYTASTIGTVAPELTVMAKCWDAHPRQLAKLGAYGTNAILNDELPVNSFMALTPSYAKELVQSTTFQEKQNEFLNANTSTAGGTMLDVTTTTALVTEVLTQTTTLSNTEEMQKLNSLVKIHSGYMSYYDTYVQVVEKEHSDPFYGKAIASASSYATKQSTHSYDTVATQRRFGLSGAAIDLLTEIKNLNTPITRDIFQKRLENATRDLQQQQIYNILVGLPTVSTSKGLLTNSQDITTINTANGWADFTTETEASNLVSTVVNSFANNTSRQQKPNILVLSERQYFRLSTQKVTAVITTAGGQVVTNKTKLQSLEEAFQNACGTNFKIISLLHLNKDYVVPSLQIANADYSILMYQHDDNRLDLPTEPTIVLSNNGGYDSRMIKTTFVYQYFGELFLPRPELIKCFKNVNFVI